MNLLLLFFSCSLFIGELATVDGQDEESGVEVVTVLGTLLEDGLTLQPQVDNIREVTTNSARLPPSLRPIHYTIRLQPFINGNFSIHGSVDIHLQVLQPTDRVVLNMADIITRNESVSVIAEDAFNERVRVVEQTFDPLLQLYTAHLEKPLVTTTTYVFHMEFQGFLNDKLVGFYRSVYTDVQGTKRLLAVSQFSPTDARRAFPSFDEPSFKATFDIYLARQTNMTALSNMPLINTQPIAGQEDWVWDSFNTTLPMSTYLVGFLISDFSYLESSALNHTLFKVWTRKDALDQATYVRDVAPTILTFLEDYFSIPFPLPKLDMSSVPDFKFRGMENWGLILYRETALLYDPHKSSAESKQSLGHVLAHEIAHQWFGNLVTPVWWSDLWLKEGFATFMGFAEPTWGIMEQFLTSNLHIALQLDNLRSSHPINVEVNHPDDISEIFDTISYKKGASIIWMMHRFLSEVTFRKGITNCLNAFKFDNAEQDDLWQHLTEAAHEDGILPVDLTVKTIMDSWTLQAGYPVISVMRNDTTATLTQEWFYLGEINKTSGNQPGWWVPISYTTQNNPNFQQTNPKFWMAQDRKPLEISGLPNLTHWVIVNVQVSGYYRVNYDSITWQLLTGQLASDHKAIHLANRAQLLDDAFNLAQAGLLDYSTVLTATTYLEKEEDFVPWRVALTSFSYLINMFERAAGYGALREYIRSLMVPLYDSVGFDDHPDDPHLTQFKRVIVLEYACKLGHPSCVKNAVHLYSIWMNSPANESIVPVNVQDTVMCTGVASGGEAEWKAAWTRYTKSNVGSEKAMLLSAMGCTKEVWILARYLKMAFTEKSGIRKQDASSVFTAVAYNSVGRDLAWNFLQDQWPVILEYLGPGSSHLSRIAKAASQGFNAQLELKELMKFKSDNADHLGSARRALDQSLERATLNTAWMEKNYDAILVWLNGQGYDHTL
ncbi:Aminopeptidase N-like 2 [Homarus americanus]|uniref:Aminopeptidase n=1 Tax=Homarus americanus TaxID=6706 RepID=A0A8J5JIQ0_HOMAM|nr:Aminopeptidase N-like 2 [Homarus americanus]